MLRRLITPSRALGHLPFRRGISTTNYLSALRKRYPSADPPSLVISFLILHELTAILPLSVLFGTFHYLGLGAGIVGWILAESESTLTESQVQHQQQKGEEGKWTTEGAKLRLREWIREGEEKAERVGRRYGWFGWEKESKEQREERKAQPADTSKGLSVDSLKVSGDVANVAAAYLVVKVSNSLVSFSPHHSQLIPSVSHRLYSLFVYSYPFVYLLL